MCVKLVNFEGVHKSIGTAPPPSTFFLHHILHREVGLLHDLNLLSIVVVTGTPLDFRGHHVFEEHLKQGNCLELP